MAAAPCLLRVLKLLMAMVFAAWVCLWVLRPTRAWKNAWHVAENRVGNSLLGKPGLSIVVFGYPVLSLAMLGYLYIHLASEEKRNRRQRRSYTTTNLSNPIIISRPIGIVSAADLLAAALFTALLAWTFYSNISSDFNKLTPSKSTHLDGLQLKIMRVGVRFGSLAEICLAVLFLPILRVMALFKLIGQEFEASVRFHIWIGNAMILMATIHSTAITSIWAVNHRFWSEIIKWQSTGRINLAGAIALTTGLTICITSLPPIRRKCFQFFYLAHHLYAVFIVFFLFHRGDRHFYLVICGVILFALDKILRTIQATTETCLVSASLLPCNAIMLTLSNHHGTKYAPTSIIFLNIPSISKLQWHPFSIISSSNIDKERISVIIKSQGWWTSTLNGKIQSLLASGPNSMNCFQVSMEGPYGPSTNIFQRYDGLILIAGGTGIAPFLGFLQEFAAGQGSVNMHPVEVQLIYVVKKLKDLSMLISISTLLQNKSTKLRLKTYVTQEKRSDTTFRDTMKEIPQVPTMSFDPKCPINTAQKPEGFKWKIALTGLSALIFLILVVMLNHAFLPSKNKSSSSKSPSWISDMIVIASFVLAISCSTIAMVFVRWRDSKNGGCGVNHEQPKVVQLNHADVKGIVEDYEVYFGRRPSLTDLMSELKLSSQAGFHEVGVFVCGPDSMQESIARTCMKYPHNIGGDCKTKKCSISFHSIKFSL